MKNKPNGLNGSSISGLKLKMKLSFILFFAFIFSAVANSFSQTEISLELRNVKVLDVLDKIEVDTDYKFIYSTNVYDFNKIVSIDVKNEKIANILDQIFNGNIIYEVIDKRVLLKKKMVISSKNEEFTDEEEIVQRVITGTVKDSDGIPLPGATILEEGTTNGTSTDFDGNFSITLENDDSKLLISFISYITGSYEIADLSSIDAVLQLDNASLDEVVVTGYGTQQKKLVTGAIATISADLIENRGLTSAGSALAGTTAGVYVSQNSGQAGRDNVQFKIRGYGTLNDSNPLVMIDGVEGDFNTLNPNDIESISVLKDASSSAIYGNRASNGVILVKTRRGRKNQGLAVTYDAIFSTSEVTTLPDLVYNPVTLAEKVDEANANYGIAAQFPANEMAFLQSAVNAGTLGRNTQDIYFTSAPTTQHTLGVTGGSENTNYRFSLGLLDQEGVMLGSDYKRYNVRFNLDSELNERLKIGTTVSMVRGDTNSDQFDETGINGNIRSMMSYNNMFQPVYNADGTYAYADPSVTHGNFTGNGVASSEARNFNTVRNRVLANSFIEYNVLEGLSIKATGAVNYLGESHYQFDKKIPLYSWTNDNIIYAQPNRQSMRANIEDFTTTFFLTANYEKSFGAHNLSALVGYQEENSIYTTFSASRQGHLSDTVQVMDAGDAGTAINSGSETGWATQSIFGRINYNFNEKFLLEFAVRNDGSSRFSEGNKWGVFPSLSAGYILFDENNNQGIIDFLKFRASWGQLGNQNIGNFEYARKLSLNQYYTYGGVASPGVGQSTLGNNDLTWETSTMTNFGLNFNLKNGVYGEFDIYKRNTEDILYNVGVNPLSGFTTQTQNVGEVENTGTDILLGYRGNVGELNFSASLNISSVKNKLVAINPQGGEPLEQVILNPSNGSSRILKVGEDLGSFWGYKTDGFIQTAAELGNGTPESPTQVAAATVGDLKYVDINGDGKINPDDRTVIGTENPSITWGMNLNLGYKNFDMTAIVQAVGGWDYLGTRRMWYPIFNKGETINTMWLDSWTPSNTDASMPKIFDGNGGSDPLAQGASDFWIHDRSFVRLKNLQIGYTVSLPDNIPLDYLRIYLNGTNLFTITDMPLIDPEGINGTAANELLGEEAEYLANEGTLFPNLKTLSFGLSARF